MIVTSKIKLDMAQQGAQGRVFAVQGDGNTRAVEAELLANGSFWTPDADWEAAITYRKPDGTKGMYNLLDDGSSAITISGSTATVILAAQMLTVPGTVRAAIVFNNQRLDQLTSFPFLVSVARNQFAGAQQSEDYIRLQWLEDKLEERITQLISTEEAVRAGVAAQEANTAAAAAQEQAAAAGNAAASANAAASLADTAAAGADTARDAANTATDAANQAAAAAQTAADTAAAEINQMKGELTALSAVCRTVDHTEDGTVIQLTDCVERPLKGLRILGRTVQDGTPTPDTPIPFVSVGNGGSITVTIETPQNESAPQAMTVDIENGLAGISGTVCDEIDFARGVRIVRFKRKRVSPELNWQYSPYSNRFFVPDADYKLGDGGKIVPNVKCTHFKAAKGNDDKIISYINDSSHGYAYRYSDLNGDISAWKAFLANNEVYIIGELDRAIEIPLTTDEISAYSALHTYKPNTTIYNDVDSEMEVGYQADTKLYMDKQFAELRNAIVSLGGNI